MKLKFRDLEVIHAVLQTGSTRKAAEVLHVTQPAVSMSVKASEESLGFALFSRANGRLTPTDRALVLAPHLQKLMVEHEAVHRVAKGIAEGKEGAIALAAPQSIINGFVSDAVASFQDATPNSRVVFRSVPVDSVAALIEGGMADLGLSSGTLVRHGLEVLEILSSRFCCVLPSHHRLASHAVLRPELLVGENLYSYRNDSFLGRQLTDAFRAAGMGLDLKVQTNSSSAMQFATHQAGIAIVDYSAVRNHPPSGMVVRILRPDVLAPIFLLLPPQSAASPSIARLIQSIRRAAAEIADEIAALPKE